jgi:Ca2+-transporting ATPase
MTMTFAVMAFGAVLGGLVLRRDPASGLMPPVLKALAILAIPAVIVVLGTELPFMQDWLMTESLTGPQWLVVAALSVVGALVPEVDKWIRRRRMPKATVTDVHATVDPSRARPVTAGA